MGKPNYLVDTNVIIDYLNKKLPAAGMEFIDSIINATPNISIITKIELLSFNTSEAHYSLLVSFIHDAIILDLIDRIVDRSIDIRKKNKIKLPDAIIAATSLVYGLILISHDTADFKHIQGLKIVDPHSV
jgi:predicted nucleic acid-binding protein